MREIEAIYQEGVFRPLGPVSLAENQRVRLDVQPIESMDMLAWQRDARQLQRRLFEQHGAYPDSTTDIAADRNR